MANGRSWTIADTQELQRLAAAGLDDASIARRMHRDRFLIVRKRGEHKIERGQSAAMSAVMARLKARRTMATRA